MFGHMSAYLPSLLPAALVVPVLAGAAAFAFVPRATAGNEPRISGPIVHDNITLFLVHGESASGPVPLTLDEALARGAVEVHETGTVGELEIENVGGEEVFVHAGDIVKGGRQDRVVTSSLVLKSKSGRVPLAVFCVEAGRWAPRGKESSAKFASAGEMLPTREAKLAMKKVMRPVAAGGATKAEALVGLDVDTQRNIEQRVQRGLSGGGDPSPQSEVWRNVSEIQQKLSANLGETVAAPASATSLQLALENDKLASARQGYVDAFKDAVQKSPDAIGYVLAVNGRISSADIYASHDLFLKLWPKLVTAAATEAISRKDGEKEAQPTVEAAAKFLADAASGEEHEMPSIDGQKLATREATKTIDFETRRASGAVLHRSVLMRD